MIKFFNPQEEQRILESLRQVENRTSGEIRVHLSANKADDVVRAAEQIFLQLGMHQTEEQNGVLFYIVPKHHQFAIIGDKGIHERVPSNFWNDIRDLAQSHFRQGKFAEGVCRALDRIGEKLQEFFPARENDVNELSDEITYD